MSRTRKLTAALALLLVLCLAVIAVDQRRVTSLDELPPVTSDPLNGTDDSSLLNTPEPADVTEDSGYGDLR